MKQEQKNKLSIEVKALLWFAGIIFTCLLIGLTQCEKPSPPPTENTDLQIHNNVIKRRIIGRVHKVDQVKQIIPKAQKSAQVYYDTVIVYMPDTCKPYLSTYKLLRDSTEKILLHVVAYQDSTVKDQDTIIRNDSIMLVRAYKAVEDTVKYYKKAVRKAKWKGRLEGAALYAVIREGLNAAKNLKP